jgi:hypothetical protein
MKARHLLLVAAAALAGSVDAGDITLYNDQAYPRLIRLGHKGQKLYAGWMYPGQTITVHVDETRKGKPILLVDTRTQRGSSNRYEWELKAYPLPKKAEPVVFNMSWFPRGI